MGGERRVVVLAIGLAAGFVALAAAALLLPPTARLGTWLPLHLLLAGGAATAISGVMPFFSAAVSGAPPAPVWLRQMAVTGVALGALLVAGGRLWSPALAGPDAAPAGIGGLVYLAGLTAAAGATLLPLRAALGGRRVIIGAIYGIALADVLVGAALATLLLLDWPGFAANWAALKPAHAWLNLFGFVSLVIAGSLLHLLPTVAGARIGRTPATVVSFVAVAAGPPIAALGFALDSHAIAVGGALTLLAGAIALAAHARNVLRVRGRWTTDPGWHRLTTWSLLAGIGWFIVGAAVAASDVVAGWASGSAWQLAPLLVPVGIGWVAQVLVGASSHLLPAVGPGSPERHARQRAVLGWAATARLVTLNAGVALMTAGVLPGLAHLLIAGLLAVAVAGGAGLMLLARALLQPEPAARLRR